MNPTPPPSVFDWINNLAAETTTTIKTMVVVLALGFILYHTVAGKMSVARVIVAAISGGLVISIVFGMGFISDMFGGFFQ